MKTILSHEEMKEVTGGEIVAIASVMAILATAIVTVVCYRLFMSTKGKTKLPGGFEFDWGK